MKNSTSHYVIILFMPVHLSILFWRRPTIIIIIIIIVVVVVSNKTFNWGNIYLFYLIVLSIESFLQFALSHVLCHSFFLKLQFTVTCQRQFLIALNLICWNSK